MEIKVADSTSDIIEDKNEALKQIKARAYADKYTGMEGASVYEAGMIFSRETRNLAKFEWEEISVNRQT